MARYGQRDQGCLSSVENDNVPSGEKTNVTDGVRDARSCPEVLLLPVPKCVSFHRVLFIPPSSLFPPDFCLSVSWIFSAEHPTRSPCTWERDCLSRWGSEGKRNSKSNSLPHHHFLSCIADVRETEGRPTDETTAAFGMTLRHMFIPRETICFKGIPSALIPARPICILSDTSHHFSGMHSRTRAAYLDSKVSKQRSSFLNEVLQL